VDWPTLLVSAGISAALSVVVSLLAVPHTVARTERAKRRDAAKVALREAVEPLQDHLSRYRFNPDAPSGRRVDVLMPEDLGNVQRVLKIIGPLPWLRRLVIKRRMRRIWGRSLVQQAVEYPTSPTEEGAFLSLLTAQVGGSIPIVDVRTGNLAHDYFSGRRDDDTGRQLARELRRLARGL